MIYENILLKEIFTKCFIAASITLLVYVLFRRLNDRSNKKLPPGPKGLPFLGYLPFLSKEPFRKLDELSKIYGNVFSLYMGQTYVVFLGNYEAVKECFSKSTTLNRPENVFSFLPGGVGLSSVNDDEWVEQRKFCMKVMRDLGLGKHEWELLITEEVNELIKTVSDWGGKPTDFNDAITTSVSNNIVFLVLGKKLPMGHPDRLFLNRCIDAVSQFFGQAGLHIYFPTVSNLLVKLRLLSYDEHLNKMLAFKDYLRKEAQNRDVASINSSNVGSMNFFDQYLYEMKLQQNSGKKHYFNETNLYGNTIALLVGASDTTRTSLNWLLLAMASYPELQQKVRDELDLVLGSRNMASWEDRLRLPFTLATIMEGQRWKTVAPLNTSRIAQEDIKICGSDIPKWTTIIANNWGLHNDENYWKNADRFLPERFLLADGSLNSKPESYVPFSYGKRNCPGTTVAMMEILLYFSGFIKNFYLEHDGNVSTAAKLGLTYQPEKTVLRFIPREI